jgi:UDPglucose 6-dehydrogenase
VVALHNPTINVEVLDRDERRIGRWKSPHLPIHEPGLNNIVRLTRDGALRTAQGPSDDDAGDDSRLSRRDPNLAFTSDTANSISQADMIFLAVNTPTKTAGVGAGRATNMTALDGAVKDVALYAKPGTIIVEKSTVPCGTAHRIRRTVLSLLLELGSSPLISLQLDALRPGVSFEILSNPEFLSEGSAIKDLMKPDRVIIGSSDTPSGHLAAEALASLYVSWIPSSQIVRINAWSSELSKLVANAMLAQRISSINSISAICESTGANVEEVAKCVGLDARIGPQFLKAGLGFGGSCFRKDIASLTFLAESLGLDEVAEYWAQVNSLNEAQRRRFARKVLKRFNENLVGRKIAMLGFAFKKNTGDARESPAVDVIRLLLDEQPTEIAIFDPYCDEDDILREISAIFGSTDGFPGGSSPVKIYTDPYQACSEACAILVVNDCDQFRNTAARPRNGSATGQLTPVEKPFEDVCMSEGDMLLRPNESTTAPPAERDMLAGFDFELGPTPLCVADCPDCKSKARGPVSTEPVEWARIVYSMKEPKWIFDGRGILDVPELERLGDVRVDAVGRWRPEDGQRIW